MAAEEPAADYRTLFVTGLAFSCTKEALEAACSEYGPIRSCFLVKPAGSEQHKVCVDLQCYASLAVMCSLIWLVPQGCGYVQYALQQDMQTALQELNGRELAGRKLTVSSSSSLLPVCVTRLFTPATAYRCKGRASEPPSRNASRSALLAKRNCRRLRLPRRRGLAARQASQLCSSCAQWPWAASRLVRRRSCRQHWPL